MFKRDGRVYTQIIKNCSANELLPILKEFSELDSSTIYSYCWKAYDELVDYAALAHYRVKHSKNEFANGKNHINGIENFFSKRVRLISSKQNAAKHKSCDLRCYCLLKGYECSEVEFRYNTKTTQENLCQKLLKLIRGLISSNASRS